MSERTAKITKKLFISLLKEYQEVCYIKKDSGFVFDHVNALRYLYHKTCLHRHGSYAVSPSWIKIEKTTLRYLYHKTCLHRHGSYAVSPSWIKIEKTTINPINKYKDKWFQYIAAVTLKK